MDRDNHSTQGPSKPPPKPPPLVALVTRFVMLKRRQGVIVSGAVHSLLAVLAERWSERKGCAFPGMRTLERDLGMTRWGVRRCLRSAVELGAITYRIGCGRGRAGEVRFTSDVRNAPQLDYLSRLDRVHRIREDHRKGCADAPLSRPAEPEKGCIPAPKGVHERTEKGCAGIPPTASVTASVPLSLGALSLGRMPNGPTAAQTTERMQLLRQQAAAIQAEEEARK